MAYITKGIGGFYYVKTPDGIVECKARGIFRKRGITPVAGDNVTLSDDGTMIDEILPRKNVFIRPPIANLDILFIVTSTTQPVPSTLVLDQLAARGISLVFVSHFEGDAPSCINRRARMHQGRLEILA